MHIKKPILPLLAALATALATAAALPAQPVSTITKGPVVKLSPAAFGYNTQTLGGPGWDKQPFLDRIAELDPSNFRYPAGTAGNFWDWRAGTLNDIGRKYKVMGSGEAHPYKLEDLKKVYDRSKGTTEPIYMVNMLTSTLDDQIAMLKHAKEIGLPVRYIELGNEFYMDDHPKNYNYLKKYPTVKDYVDDCRVWVNKLRQEFPGARIAMVAINNPAGWTADNRKRSREWNKGVMDNLTGFDVDAFTFHNYAKNKFSDQTPEDLLSQSIQAVSFKSIKRGIPEKYPYWVTEYNSFQPENKLPGLWVNGLSKVMMTAQMLSHPSIELVCLHNIVGPVSSVIYDKDTKIAGGATARKYALSATGQGLKVYAQAQKGAKTVCRLVFSNNPEIASRGKSNYSTLYGYLFNGAGESAGKALIVNLGAKPMTVALAGLGFTPQTAEQTSAPTLRTPIVDDKSITKTTTTLADQKQLTLKPYSVTLIK